MAHLVIPSTKYKKSFLEAVKEYLEDQTYSYQGSSFSDLTLKTFDAYLKRHKDYELGLNLPPDFVPASDFWLVEGDKYLGTANIRHRLNTHLLNIGGHIGYRIRPSERKKGYGTLALKLALLEAKKLGIARVLVTCDHDNIASARIIEKNGGIFENEFVQGNGLPNKKRYWIEV